MQDEKRWKSHALEAFESGCKSAIFTMLVLVFFQIIAGLNPANYKFAYLLTVLFSFLASLSYFSFRKLRSQERSNDA